MTQVYYVVAATSFTRLEFISGNIYICARVHLNGFFLQSFYFCFLVKINVSTFCISYFKNIRNKKLEFIILYILFRALQHI